MDQRRGDEPKRDAAAASGAERERLVRMARKQAAALRAFYERTPRRSD